MGGRRRTDGFAVLAFLLGASVDEEGDGKGKEEEDEDYDGGYYTAVQARLGVRWCIFETE